ncbi:hypothetical protein [Aureispira anguillae]|uniref:Uncharacterized protein n=1 Tax=Aureispira anguillae TaxID=2864201 RepID=A0A915YCM7_9BACT|nr:hypothetical protein [Aureispira anguillae]BDS10606.1 hypothetical protein AsAng_0013140 [Aureispira anguillae]BDS10889.1 hypothetical protein AsAng_0015990 [Aureispira anguillae]
MKTNTTKTTERNRSFYQHVLNTLSAADFKSLPQQLGLSQRMTTLRLRNPNLLDYPTIQKLVPILGADLKEVVQEYELGYDSLSAREYKKLMHI